MHNQIESIIKFFNIQTKCPICGEILIRKLKTKFTDSNTLEYISDPKQQSMHDYKSFIFIKHQKSITGAQLIQSEENKFTDGSPTIINLKERIPPSLHFLKLNEAYVSCYRKGIEYQLCAEGPSLQLISERFVTSGRDIVITPRKISDLSTKTEIPVNNNFILKYTPQEAVDMLNRIMILK